MTVVTSLFVVLLVALGTPVLADDSAVALLDIQSVLPGPARVAEIKRLVSTLNAKNLFHDILIYSNEKGFSERKIENPAFSAKLSSGQDLMAFNPKYFESYPPSIRSFVSYHELGHIRLNQTGGNYPNNPVDALKIELEADVFAVLVNNRVHGQPDPKLIEYLTGYKGTDRFRAWEAMSLFRLFARPSEGGGPFENGND